MKLAIVGWRPWSVVRRYKSLIVNAKKLGHQVVGIALEHYGDRPKTASLFRDLGVPVGSLNQFRPDAVFGECFWNAEENAARVWARGARKKYFVLDHGKWNAPVDLYNHGNMKPPNVMLTVNEKNADYLCKEFRIQAIPVGVPNFDVEYEVDIDKVRIDLGVTNQPMVALFLEVVYQGIRLEYERERLFSFLALAQRKNWKVFMHIDPDEQGRKTRFLDRGHPRRAFLRELQGRGGIFVSCFPGDYNDVIFKPCGPMALMRSADLVCGTYHKMFEAYVATKKYFWMREGEEGEGHISLNRHPNLVKVDPDYGNIVKAIEENTASFEQHPAYVKRWFYKLDGKCWMRILAVAEASRRR